MRRREEGGGERGRKKEKGRKMRKGEGGVERRGNEEDR